jgi:hypothetical protein
MEQIKKEELVAELKRLTDRVVEFIQRLDASEDQSEKIDTLEERVKELKGLLDDAETEISSAIISIQDAESSLQNIDCSY